MAIHAIYATGGPGIPWQNGSNATGNTPETAASVAWPSNPPATWVSASAPGVSATALPADPATRGWYSFASWSNLLAISSVKADGVMMTVMLSDRNSDGNDEFLEITFSGAAHSSVPDDAMFTSMEIECEFAADIMYIYRARINWLVNYNSGSFQNSFGAETGRSHTRSGR